MGRFKHIVLVSGALIATVAIVGPAFAWGHYWTHQGDWQHSEQRWHEKHYYRRHGHGGPVHPLSQALPNPRLTPGVTNPAVTQANIRSTICVRGYAQSIRPPESYTERLKREQTREYGYKDRKLWHYEEDHLIALSVGGSPTNPKNLWPQPHKVVGGWGSYAKDRLESQLHWLVCHRGLALATAQRALAHDWIASYKKYLGPVPNNHRLHWH